MNITHLRSVDMARRMPMVPVDAVQGDGNTRTLKLKLLENGTEWAVPEGITAAVAFRKSDGTKGLYDTLPDGTKAVSVEGSTVSAVLAPQVLTCAGEVSAAVVFHDENLNQLAAFPIVIRVAANPAAGQAASNDYYRYSTMEAVSEAIDAFLSKAEEALQTVHDTATEDAPAIACEAAGEVISVADAADRPLKGLSIYGKTIQNGTPTPDAPVALESVRDAVCVDARGKNLIYSIDKLQPKTVGGVTFTPVYDGNGLLDYINVNGTCTASNWSDFDLLTVAGNKKAILPKGQTVTLHGGTAAVSLCVEGSGGVTDQGTGRTTTCVEGSGGVTDQGTGRTTTLTGDQYWVFLRVWSGRTVNNEKVYPMLNFGGTALPYEPPKPRQTLTATAEGGLHGIPVTSGGNYTDENGQQWICSEIDFARGVYVQRVLEVTFDGTEDWFIAENGEINARNNLAPNNPAMVQCICSHYPAVSRYLAYDNRSVSKYQGFAVNNGRYYVVDNINCNGDADVFKALLAEQYAAGTPVTVQYVLAEPIETPLTAEELAQFAALRSNKPNTTAFNDSGAEMKLGYVADTKLYIDQKIAAISAAMLG